MHVIARFLILFLVLQSGEALAQSFQPLDATLDPVTYGVESDAVEVPWLRTEKTITFRLSDGSYQAVGSGIPLFRHDKNGALIPVSDIGKRTPEGIIFDRLPRDAEIFFDLRHPRYTYFLGGHWFSLEYKIPAKAVFEYPSTVKYQLSDDAVLRFTVENGIVTKKITIDGSVDRKILRFSIHQDPTLRQTFEANRIILAVSDGAHIFTTQAPVLLDSASVVLDHTIALERIGSEVYQYAYDESGLPETYVIDPTSGPNSPGTMANDTSYGTIAWSNPDNAKVSDNSYALATVTSSGLMQTNYLKATNFGFSLPSKTIKGIKVEVEAKGIGEEKDSRARLVKAGTIQTTDKSTSSALTPTDSYITYGGTSDLWGDSTWTASDINESGFGFVFAAFANSALFYDFHAYVDHIRISVTYFGDFGETCSSLGGDECSMGACGVCGTGIWTAPCGANPAGTLLCGTTCGGCVGPAGLDTLPSGVTAVLASNESVDMTDRSNQLLYNGQPVRFKKSSTRIADIRLGFACGNVTPTILTNTADNKGYFHISTLRPTGTGYILYVPKSADNDRVRVCSGATVLGCTSTGSWSFLANNVGQIIDTNGGFSTSGINVTVSGGYWVIDGLHGTGGQGESGGGGGNAVPEFSPVGLVLVVLGALTVFGGRMRNKEANGVTGRD